MVSLRLLGRKISSILPEEILGQGQMMSGVFPKTNLQPQTASIVKLRCPLCRHAGAFGGYSNVPDLTYNPIKVDRPGRASGLSFAFSGVRSCPNPECGALIFVSRGADANSRVQAYPPEVIDFDATGLPPEILASLEEAVACHAASAYRASALMVRRVLEELCEDKKAIGKTLKDRITALSRVAVIPKELLEAADELRILGNDAAHVEAKDYDAIGPNEAEIAIDLAKELLKAAYQYTSLVDRLKKLKKAPATP